jgi:hypothetical protein
MYSEQARNSIVLNNFDGTSFLEIDNYNTLFYPPTSFSYSCTSPTPSGNGNIVANLDPVFLDGMHLSTVSPCRDVGNPLYASGTDIDGEPWANPPSIGCDEVVEANLTGPLSVSILAYQTNSIVGHYVFFGAHATGRVARFEWWFSDFPAITNYDPSVPRRWTAPGDYTVNLTAYNTDNPNGVSTNMTVHIFPLEQPLLKPVEVSADGFHFQFIGQSDANYTIQYTTNLIPPVTWNWIQFYSGTDGVMDVITPASSDGTRFYRVTAQ